MNVPSPAWPRTTRPLDALEAAEPGAEALDRCVVDFAFAGERGNGGGTSPLRSSAFIAISSGCDVGLAGSFARRVFAHRV